MTLHSLVLISDSSHAIVILFILTCQLTPKSNSHVSHSFVASVYKAAFFQCLFSPVSCTVQQCNQISTRINSSMYIRTYFVCFIRNYILLACNSTRACSPDNATPTISIRVVSSRCPQNNMIKSQCF